MSELLSAEIREKGVIPFNRFMERALYCPEAGYYEQISHTPGRRGDYFTSVSVGALFGSLLARQFCRWARMGQWETWQILECGAQDGRLADDILGWVRQHDPSSWDRLRYRILEPSERRRAWQKSQLGKKYPGKVCWSESWETLGDESLCGIVLANELLDAMPVVRLGWNASRREWLEWGVAMTSGGFHWATLPRTTDLSKTGERWLSQFTDQCGAILPDRSIVELSPQALEWWGSAALRLGEGRMVALDYGFDVPELFWVSRLEGTLRSYRDHRRTDDLLAAPGEQDITAHVNWSLVREVGEGGGLATVGLTEQGRWLTRILTEAMSGGEASRLTPAEIRQFHTLTHPEHLGGRFQVFVQERKRMPIG